MRNQSSEVKEKWKDTGVKKIFIIALAPNIQENYHNVCSIWSQLQMNKCLSKYLATITTDLKLSNIIVGLSNDAICYPCIWCDVSKDDLSSCGKLRTAKSCHSNFDDWCKSGKNER